MQELDTALEAARRASAYLLTEYTRFQAIPDAPADITTDADRQAQEIILQVIRKAFPDDALCAEEATGTLQGVERTGARLWIVDPIDGTRGFARKNGEFSVMIAFVEKGEIGVGVVAQPAVSRVTYAVRRGGCWRLDGEDKTPTRCQVTTATELGQATLVQSRSRDPNRQPGYVKAIGPARVIGTYSAGIKLALVARGEADIYVNDYHAFHDWDICAGHILVTEAGGQVTGIGGQALHYGQAGAWQRHGLLATNGRLQQAVLARLAEPGER